MQSSYTAFPVKCTHILCVCFEGYKRYLLNQNAHDVSPWQKLPHDHLLEDKTWNYLLYTTTTARYCSNMEECILILKLFKTKQIPTMYSEDNIYIFYFQVLIYLFSVVPCLFFNFRKRKDQVFFPSVIIPSYTYVDWCHGFAARCVRLSRAECLRRTFDQNFNQLVLTLQRSNTSTEIIYIFLYLHAVVAWTVLSNARLKSIHLKIKFYHSLFYYNIEWVTLHAWNSMQMFREPSNFRILKQTSYAVGAERRWSRWQAGGWGSWS